jgi:histidinol-phosphatase (PHP family)
MEPIVYETHMHTPLCKHAQGLPQDYGEVAEAKGLKGIIVTCHCPLPNGMSASVRMRPEQFPDYLALVDQAREILRGRIDVRLGIESDFLPGLEPWIEKLHASHDFNYALGSVHPQIEEYKARFFQNDWPSFHRIYFQHLAEAAETGLYDCLAHPDIVKNIGHRHWDIKAVLPHIQKALDRIAATGIAMELNTSGLGKTVPEMNPAPSILREMNLRGIPVVVGADAHVPTRVADQFLEAYALLEEAGYDEVSIYLQRKPIKIPIQSARASLKAVASLNRVSSEPAP